MRQFNERIVLQTIRLHGELPKAEVARLTRLSAQTASVIIERLLRDGLVIKRTPLRGRVGQPSVPIALNADGAFTLGIKVGRRSLDVLAMDFVGQVRHREILNYEYPDPEIVFPAIKKNLSLFQKRLQPFANRLVGVGVAAPLWLGGWKDFLAAPSGVMDAWNDIDIQERIQSLTPLPVEFAKDTTAACAAELVVGQGRALRNFLYLFVGTFIGGGLVIDGHLRVGPHGNAGAIGSLPLPQKSRAAPLQLLHRASAIVLEQAFKEVGAPVAAVHDERALSADLLPLTNKWLKEASHSLAFTVASSTAVLDLDAVIIDGALHHELITRIIASTQAALDDYSWEGIARPRLLPGSIGADARAMGGAILPLYTNFAPTQELFLKSESVSYETTLRSQYSRLATSG